METQIFNIKLHLNWKDMLQAYLIAAGRNEENIDLQFNEKQHLIVEHPIALSRHFGSFISYSFLWFILSFMLLCCRMIMHY